QFDNKTDARRVSLVVELDVGDAPNHHAGAFHRRAYLEPSDVIEAGDELVRLPDVERRARIAHFQSQDEQRDDRSEERRVGSEWSSDVCSSDLSSTTRLTRAA